MKDKNINNNTGEENEKKELALDNLENLSKLELVELGKDLKIKNYSKLSKSELIDEIKKVKPVEIEVKEKNNLEEDELNNLQRIDLVEIAKNLKIKNYSRFSKSDLIKSIIKARKEEEVLVVEEPINIVEEIKTPSVEVSTPANSKYDDLENLPLKDLVEMGKELKIKNYSRLNKKRLIKSIQELVLKDPSDIVEAETIEEAIKTEEESLEVVTPIEKVKETVPVSEKERLLEAVLPLEELVEITQTLEEPKEELVIEDKTHIRESFIKLNEEGQIQGQLAFDFLETDKKAEATKELVEEKVETKVEDTNLKTEVKTTDEKVETETKVTEEKTELKTEEVKTELAEKVEVKSEAEILESGLTNLKKDQVSKEEERRYQFLLRPSRFPFGKTNEEFLMKDEEDIKLAELSFEEDKIVLLPIDPTQMFCYWNLNTKTIADIQRLGLTNLYLKVNDVTGIVYNGQIALNSWFEKCLVLSKNWYIPVPESGRNYCVELGFMMNDRFILITRSNTINVPRRTPSPIVQDSYVIVNYPETETKTAIHETETASSVYIARHPIQKPNLYYELNEFNIAENYNLKKMPQKMPVFTIEEEIHDHFVKEYDITGKTESNKQTTFNQPPEKLPGNPPPITNSFAPLMENVADFGTETVEPIQEESYLIKNEKTFQIKPVINKTREKALSFNTQAEPVKAVSLLQPVNNETNTYQPIQLETNVAFNNKLSVPEIVVNNFEYFPEMDKDGQIIKQYYYELPPTFADNGKPVKVYYEWVENNIPYRKEIYWVSDAVPTIHEKIYKISWGPSWTKEYIGGSEIIRYIGASERFLGASEIHLGGSEMFIESSGRYPLANEYNFTPSGFPGGSEMFIESSYRNPSPNANLIGASEQLQAKPELLANTTPQPVMLSGKIFRKWFE